MCQAYFWRDVKEWWETKEHVFAFAVSRNFTLWVQLWHHSPIKVTLGALNFSHMEQHHTNIASKSPMAHYVFSSTKSLVLGISSRELLSYQMT